ncbi:SDR family NAD(P)-dependent oxidoreductase [Microbacterium sp. ASV49]|uniref:SDR family NAD(P)-dependent oxidoreductase n=1 Tax=Microbacterium candidum TaxID=3041922 RepID=A0ABT7MYZ4_9MICO|nr:SDR family NAD(P)-dependent oxidoreductase [Microbacterium sp. ASV49]MDL9979669.1 SDR family NAD(P)-dependent oxidoreductase [Microbacterium sp. ASV49]
MDLGLAGSVAIVTGAGRGIGLAVTRVLIEEGCRVLAAIAQFMTSTATSATTSHPSCCGASTFSSSHPGMMDRCPVPASRPGSLSILRCSSGC